MDTLIEQEFNGESSFEKIFRFLEFGASANKLKIVQKVVSNAMKYPPKLSIAEFNRLKLSLLKVTNCDKKTVQLLLDFFKLKDKKDAQKQLKIAVLEGDLEKAERLLRNGAKLKDLEWETSPAIYAFCRWNLANRKKTLELLVEHGLDPGFRTQGYGKNLLFAFVENFVKRDDVDAVGIAEILLERVVSTKDDEELSRLLYSSLVTRHLGLVSFFIDRGANVNSKDVLGSSLLNRAALLNEKKIVDLLLSRGADVNAKDDSDQTALHVASTFHRQNIIVALIERGADVNAKDEDGRTPFSKLDPERSKYEECRVIFMKEFSKLALEDVPIDASDMKLMESDEKAREIFERCRTMWRAWAVFAEYSVPKESMSKNFVNSQSSTKLLCCKGDWRNFLEEATQG